MIDVLEVAGRGDEAGVKPGRVREAWLPEQKEERKEHGNENGFAASTGRFRPRACVRKAGQHSRQNGVLNEALSGLGKFHSVIVLPVTETADVQQLVHLIQLLSEIPGSTGAETGRSEF